MSLLNALKNQISLESFASIDYISPYKKMGLEKKNVVVSEQRALSATAPLFIFSRRDVFSTSFIYLHFLKNILISTWANSLSLFDSF